jgi:Domain of unknown function (DUF4340)
MRTWLSLAALFAIVLALGAWVYHKRDGENVSSYALSELKPGDVKRIRLERSAPNSQSGASGEAGAGATPTTNTTIVLQRQDNHWLMTTPWVARAETFQVDRMISILDARSAVRYPARELARYGVDHPQVTLTLEDQAFAYGAINNLTRDQYVLTRDAVYVVPLAYITGLPRNAEALLALRLFGDNETPVRFVLPGFSLTLREGKWVLSGTAGEASADERNAWVDGWRHASAIRAARAGARPGLQQISVELKDGRTVPIDVLQLEPELVLVRRDEETEYHLFGESGKRLLTPPGSAVSAK